MKKILILLIALFPIVVNANLKVEGHYIDAEIEIGGGLNVKELIIVSGESEYFQRTLNYYSFGDKHWTSGDEVNLDNGIIYNGQGISIASVGAFEVTEKPEFGSFQNNVKEYFKEFDIKNPSDNTYNFNDKKDGTGLLKINYPVKNKKIAFYINYVITNVVVKHQDVKEINYSFNNLNFNAKETFLRVIIPYQTTDEKYHVWVHGNQSAKVQELINDNNEKAGIYGYFPEVNESINFRMTLPQEHVGVDLYLNKSNINALDDIIKLEDSRLKDTNKNNLIIKIMKYALLGLGVLYIIGSVLLWNNKNKVLFYLYLGFGLFICVFNFLFKFNLWYLYLIVILPLIIRLVKKYIVK